jgi:hypothetical protein
MRGRVHWWGRCVASARRSATCSSGCCVDKCAYSPTTCPMPPQHTQSQCVHVYVSRALSVYLSVYLPICLSFNLFVCHAEGRTQAATWIRGSGSACRCSRRTYSSTALTRSARSVSASSDPAPQRENRHACPKEGERDRESIQILSLGPMHACRLSYTDSSAHLRTHRDR